MAYYAYQRVSTETQSEHGYGLEAQRAAIAKYADEHGLTIEHYFIDAGISGNIKDTDGDEAINARAGLLELLATLTEGDTIVVLNTSRLWRSDMTKAIIRRELMRRGARVLSIEQPKYDIYSKDPSEYLINSLMEALDVYDRMSISLKLARGRATKALAGDKPAGIAPYGYRYSADKKHVEVYPEEGAAVKRMFTEAQTGKTLQQICDTLNGAGILARRGGAWTRGSVRAILRNRFYIGELQHQGKAIQGAHEPLISKIQFGKVAAQLERRHK